MELQHLKYFLDIAYFESISKAAEKNHIAQSAMSRTLSILEKELGVKLFDRTGRIIQLNECGRILMESAEKSLDILNGVPEKISYYKNQLAGNICMSLSAPLPGFEKVLSTFKSTYPLVNIDLENLISKANKLNSQYDMYIYMGPAVYEESYVSQKIYSHKIEIMLNKHHPFADRSSLSLSDLRSMEFIIPRQNMLKTILRSCCYTSGYVPNIVGEVSLPAGQHMLLDTNPTRRVTVLLSAVDGACPDGYVSLPLIDSSCSVDVHLAWSKTADLRPSVETLRDHILKHYDEYLKKLEK